MPPLAASSSPNLVLAGAGEGAFDVPEQLAFHQRADHRGAIHGDERAGRAYIMDGAGDHFLAGAGLAKQQRGPAALAKFLNQTENLARAGRLPHQDVTGFFKVVLTCSFRLFEVGLIYGAFAQR